MTRKRFEKRKIDFSHNNLLTKKKTNMCNTNLLNLYPCDYFLFPKLKVLLKETHKTDTQ